MWTKWTEWTRRKMAKLPISGSSTRSKINRLSGTRAFSLLELLVCVTIVAILTTISISTYQGAFDQQELKRIIPNLAGRLDGLRKEASETGAAITVEFTLGKAEWKVTRRKGAETTEETLNIKEILLVQRSLKFLRYEWPDGANSPVTFTFVGTSLPQGGKVFFGSSRAEAALKINNDRVWYDMVSG